MRVLGEATAHHQPGCVLRVLRGARNELCAPGKRESHRDRRSPQHPIPSFLALRISSDRFALGARRFSSEALASIYHG